MPRILWTGKGNEILRRKGTTKKQKEIAENIVTHHRHRRLRKLS